MFCSNCGKELGDKMNFCPFCGAETQKLQKASAVPEMTENAEQKCVDEISKPVMASSTSDVEAEVASDKSGEIGTREWKIVAIVIALMFAAILLIKIVPFGWGECDHCGQNGRLTKFTNDSGSVSWYCEDCTKMAKLLS